MKFRKTHDVIVISSDNEQDINVLWAKFLKRNFYSQKEDNWNYEYKSSDCVVDCNPLGLRESVTLSPI